MALARRPMPGPGYRLLIRTRGNHQSRASRRTEYRPAEFGWLNTPGSGDHLSALVSAPL